MSDESDQSTSGTEHHVALCSGGKDSIAATHAAMVCGPAEEVVFLDTGTGPENSPSAIDATTDWIRSWCDQNDWPFRVVETPDEYAEWVAENGYPGPSLHRIAYIKLKDHAIDELRKDVDGELHCWTGIRRHESDQRMRVAHEDERGDGRWYWHKPLVEFTDERRNEYLEAFGLEAAPIVEQLGRSAECWCGCFGDRCELIDLEAAGYGEHADWLRSLETPGDGPREQQQWAGYNWDREDWAEADDLQMTLCSSCGPAQPDGGDRSVEPETNHSGGGEQ
jgi:3'-phosphoadenosine 5'-phosphosulfate sulfotransferase (PAPS reductase)/FAD synthetase